MTADRIDTHRILEAGWIAEVEHYLTIGSTNDRAKQCAALGAHRLPLLVLADEQTAGRGRGSNRWWTGQGSLALSILLDMREIGIDRAQSPLMALAAAVAVVETVASVAPSVRAGIHWPNDVYADRRKLAGILVEVPSSRFCVVGIGVNTNNRLDEAPTELAETAVTLRDLTHTTYNHTELLLTLLDRLAGQLKRLADAPEVVAASANAMCLQRDGALNVETGGTLLSGQCLGIAPDGALILRTDEGTRNVVSGILRQP